MMLMQPTFMEVYDTAIEPFFNGDMEVIPAFEAFMSPMREFMISNTRQEDLRLILSLQKG